MKPGLRLLVLGILSLAIAFWPAPASLGVLPVDRYVRVEASSFSFSPETIRVNPGDRVTIELVATDFVHGLSIDEYDAAISADPGQPARMSFTADRPGTFRFRCSVACGAMHPFMVGKIAVGPNWLLLRGAALALVVLSGAFWMSRP